LRGYRDAGAFSLNETDCNDRVFKAAFVRGTMSPNTANDKSTTSNTAETQPTSVSDSDESITVKIMNNMLSDLE